MAQGIFLGTGTSQGVPVIGCSCEVCRSLDFRDKRLRTSFLLQAENKTIIFDTGPDFRQQMLREKIQELDAVVFTHEHKDHTAGLDDVRAFNFKQQRDMPLYAHQRVLNQLKQEFSYAFAEHKYPGVPLLEVYPIDKGLLTVEGIAMEALEVMHYKLPVLGFRYKNFAYLTDLNRIPAETASKLQGLDILVLSALQQQQHISHFSLQEAIEAAQQINAKQTYFTHISHRMGLHRNVEKLLPEGINLAYDGLKISL